MYYYILDNDNKIIAASKVKEEMDNIMLFLNKENNFKIKRTEKEIILSKDGILVFNDTVNEENTEEKDDLEIMLKTEELEKGKEFLSSFLRESYRNCRERNHYSEYELNNIIINGTRKERVKALEFMNQIDTQKRLFKDEINKLLSINDIKNITFIKERIEKYFNDKR